MTKFIIIKGNGNSGKTTTIWLTFLELLNQNAVVNFFGRIYNGTPLTPPTTLPAPANRYDFVAEVTFKNKRIVLMSMGDVATAVDAELHKILPTNPDFVICASRSQNRGGSTWALFETKYLNTMYERICMWSEFADDPTYELVVKYSTVEAIIKYLS